MTYETAPDGAGREETERPLPLPLLEPGRSAVIVGIGGPGYGMRRRLSEMGLTPGVVVRVLPGHGGGALIVERDGCRIAIGRGMGHRIAVLPVTGEDENQCTGNGC